MKVVRSKEFTATRAWGAEQIAAIRDATVRLHWTDQPYRWHVNDGDEVFAVMNGVVDMHYRVDGVEHVATLQAGDIVFAAEGDAHCAHPRGQARILVIERAGSD
jgi:mannose-6-phosphate isomerase-like protein (cupin superfamily)